VGVRIAGLRTATVLALLVAWELAVRAGLVDPLFVPAPTAVGGVLGEVAHSALPGVMETLGKVAVAYSLSVILGAGLGVVLGSGRVMRDVVSPFVVLLYGLPKILVLPWIVLVLGTGVAPAVVYGTLHGFFPVLLLVMGSVRDVDPALVTVARAFGATPRQIYTRIILPAIMPALLGGLRLAIIFALLGVLIVEMFAGVRGVGFLLGAYANAFQAAELCAATLLVSSISIGIVLALDAATERLSRWR
jgi:NitT/TauT family transport system permease protein